MDHNVQHVVAAFGGVEETRSNGEVRVHCPICSHRSLWLKEGDDIPVVGWCANECTGVQGRIMEILKKGSIVSTPITPKEPTPPHEFKYSIEKLERAVSGLAASKAAQDFLMARGITMETAKALSFGFEYGYVVIPTFLDGVLIAVKKRSIAPVPGQQKWFKHNRDLGVYYLFNRDAATLGDDLYVVESELDAAMLTSIGLAAVSVDSSGHKLTALDAALLKQAGRVILALDTDEKGQECAKRLETAIPENKRLRIVPPTKDLGDLFKEAPDRFSSRLAKLVRFAAITRRAFTWDDLLTESEIVDQQGLELKYVVDKLVPERRITMLFGPEKSCKSLLAYYIGKCAANGRKVLDNFTTKQMPCLYVDAEDGILGEYVGWMQGIGAEQVRFRTLLTGVPALSDPALLAICRAQKPLLVVDSLHKFLRSDTDSTNPWKSSDMETVLEKLRQLCVAGATVILIHHATKSNPEMYRDSSAIGAGVDFLFAVIGAEPENGLKRVRVIGLPSRGAQPPNLNLIAFPHLIEKGKFTLEENPPKTDVERIVDFVDSIGKSTKRSIREGVKGIGSEKKDAALAKAVERGVLKLDAEGFYSVPRSAARSEQLFGVPQARHSSGTEPNELPF